LGNELREGGEKEVVNVNVGVNKGLPIAADQPTNKYEEKEKNIKYIKS